MKTGRVKLVWRGIAIIGPNSIDGLRALYASARQNKLWNLVDRLYQLQGAENSGWITVPVLRDAAKSVGVDPAKMLAAANSPAVTGKLKAAASQADQDKVAGTPTFVLERPASPARQVQSRSLDAATFDAALTNALK